MKIRRATIADLPQVYDLLNALRKASVWGSFPIEPVPAYVHSRLMLALYDPHQAIFVVEFASDFPALDGELIGVCGVELAQHRFLPGLRYLQEWALYIKPRCRSMGIGKALWKEAAHWGREQGAYGSVYGKTAVRRAGYAVEEMIFRVFLKEPERVGLD